MATPTFTSLEALSGHDDFRLVAGSWMDQEEYEMCQWTVVKEYRKDDGSTGRYWAASLEGLRKYGALVAVRREERIRASVNRREADDEWSTHVTSLLDREP